MTDCALCDHPRIGTLEAEFIRGNLSIMDIYRELKDEGLDVDIPAVMAHFEDHDSALEGEVEKKKKFMGKSNGTPDTNLETPYIPEPLPKPTQIDEESHLGQLYGLLGLLKDKVYEVSHGKDVRALGTLTKEIRENLKEIERVKKDTKASLADRTDMLMDEHAELNRFLLFNLCAECGDKHQQFLKGTFITFAVDAHGKDGNNHRTDDVNSGTVE